MFIRTSCSHSSAAKFFQAVEAEAVVAVEVAAAEVPDAVAAAERTRRNGSP